MTHTTTTTKMLYLFGAAVLGATSLFLWVLIMPHAKADSTRGTDDHLVTIHDRGKEKSVISNKDSLGEVLKDAGVVLDKNDIVEPGLDQKLVAESYQVNIYRARPVVIADGNHKLLVMSAYQTPKLIARHASVELHDEDAVSMRISDNFVRDGANQQLTELAYKMAELEGGGNSALQEYSDLKTATGAATSTLALASIAASQKTNAAAMSKALSDAQLSGITAETQLGIADSYLGADMGAEMANLTKYQIMMQAGTSALSNANQSAQTILGLFR